MAKDIPMGDRLYVELREGATPPINPFMEEQMMKGELEPEKYESAGESYKTCF